MADFLIREGEIVFCKPIARAVLRDVDAFHLVHAVYLHFFGTCLMDGALMLSIFQKWGQKKKTLSDPD